jgi:hypothetical protein
MAHNRMKQQADQGHQFAEGDQVFLLTATIQENFPQG